MTDKDRNETDGSTEAAVYIEALAAELARIAAANRLYTLQHILDMAREEAASIARPDRGGDPSFR
ncbi:hypothetical protein [Ancylobacter oerskovii]|uniref:Uncharacterized protein n=1 Tax=Ancylobacter oerskovii TaxID=459519 RepID=A0ABW4Z323_9HYPH|nr:hypothetical protein [Ancylobacter oerskovii]MBS7544783.1 hypothetical protein [Ancylobacter oerskovii]